MGLVLFLIHVYSKSDLSEYGVEQLIFLYLVTLFPILFNPQINLIFYISCHEIPDDNIITRKSTQRFKVFVTVRASFKV
jgi:hypothetical protein